MAQAYLNQDDIKALEQTRQRLFQLTNNIGSLKQDVLRNNPLPQWSSLQTSASILAQNIQSLTSHLSRHSELLNRTVVYPSTTYPGREQEGLLTQLLRKKMEPQVETWVEEGREIGNNEASATCHDEELWTWATGWIGDRVAKYALEEAGDNYTVEERERGIESVNTGLRRKLEEDESSDDEDEDEDESEDEDEEMEDVGVNVTSAGRISAGQVEFGLGEMKKYPDGKTRRNVADILRLATSGAVMDQGVSGLR